MAEVPCAPAFAVKRHDPLRATPPVRIVPLTHVLVFPTHA